MHAPASEHTCKNCGNIFQGNYCNVCGEKVYTEHDKKVLHFFEDAVHFISHFEGTLITTLKTIFSKPGQLSTDYCNGIRKKYYKPLSLFFLLVVIYLVFPFFPGLNMDLKFHMSSPVYGNYAEQKIQEIITSKKLNLQQVSDLFHEKSEKASKILLVLIIPLTAFFFWLFAFRKRKYFFDHLVFSTEINSMYLLWGFLILPLLIYSLDSILRYFGGNNFPLTDDMSVLLLYLPLIIFVAVAVKRFYSFKKLPVLLVTLLFTVAHYVFVITIYKFILFIVVVYQM